MSITPGTPPAALTRGLTAPGRAIRTWLTYDAHIIATGAGSYRLRTATARRQPGGT